MSAIDRAVEHYQYASLVVQADRDEARAELEQLRDVAIAAASEADALRAERDELRDELEMWKGGNLYPSTYREAVEYVVKLRATVAEQARQIETAREHFRSISSIPPHFTDATAIGDALLIARAWLAEQERTA